jgi:hypothetical protein
MEPTNSSGGGSRNVGQKVNAVFSAGLGRQGRIAAWVVALAGAVRRPLNVCIDMYMYMYIYAGSRESKLSKVYSDKYRNSSLSYDTTLFFDMQGLWTYMDNKDNGKRFSLAEHQKWNQEKKKSADAKPKDSA